MAIGDDFSVSASGDIRYTGSGTNYTVLALYRWLADLMDDAAAAGDDQLDISDAAAAERSTDNVITLNSPWNIDDVASRHLYDGSIVQSGGAEIYDGLVVVAPAGTPLQIIQNGAPAYPNFWGTSLNPDAGSHISHRFLIKVRTGGADIDGRRLLAQTRVVGKSFSAFAIEGTLRGNNVVALTYLDDLNNPETEATLAGWTDVVNVKEGYSLLDVDANGTPEPYYGEWDRGTRTIGELWERLKWLTRESTVEDSCADTGTDWPTGDGTVEAQAQSFTVGANAQYLTRARFTLKKVGSPTGNLVLRLYEHTGIYGYDGTPTGTVLAESEPLDVATLTASYAETEFAFLTPYLMTAATYYFLAVEYTGGDASNYVDVQGLQLSGTHSGNRAALSGTWAWPPNNDDLTFKVYCSPDVYGIPGETFRGITHEVAITPGTGTWVEPEPVSWGSGATAGTGQLLAVDDTDATATSKLWIQLLTGVAPSSVLITGAGGATGTAGATATERTVSVPPAGQSTGTALVGAYGFGVQAMDLAAADRMTDLNGTLIYPPNNVTFRVAGLVPGEDRILVAPLGYSLVFDGGGSPAFEVGETLTFTSPAGTAYLSALTVDAGGLTGRMKIRMLTGSPPADDSTISGGTSGAAASVNGDPAYSEDPRQLKLATTLNGATETAVVCTGAIPTDTPASGTIRIELDSGIYRRVAYTSYSGSTFTIPSTDFSGVLTATGGAGELGVGIFVSYIDKLATLAAESFSGIYAADRDLFIRVRDGGLTPVKTFETTVLLTDENGGLTVIRSSDA